MSSFNFIHKFIIFFSYPLVLLARLHQSDVRSFAGVLLDGFPRTPQQARAIVKLNEIMVERFILILAPDDVCFDRIMYRRVDPITHKSYNTKYNPPTDSYVLNRLTSRPLDSDGNAVRQRINTFNMNIGVILQCFKGKKDSEYCQ